MEGGVAFSLDRYLVYTNMPRGSMDYYVGYEFVAGLHGGSVSRNENTKHPSMHAVSIDACISCIWCMPLYRVSLATARERAAKGKGGGGGKGMRIK